MTSPRVQADAAATASFPPAPGTLRRQLRHHRSPLSALAWITAVDAAALLGHLAPAPQALAVIAGAGGVVALRTAWTHRNRRPAARWYAAGAWAGGLAVALIGAAAGVATAAAQALILAGGLVYAAPWLRSHRRRFHEREASVPPISIHLHGNFDAERAAFDDAFCQDRSAPLHGARMERPCVVPNGWQAEVDLPRGRRTTEHVIKLAPLIASLYGVPEPQIIAEHTATRAANRARLTVLTSAANITDDSLWTGSTYDPKTGCVRIGRFADSSPTHYRLHLPGSGAYNVILTGCPGAGKSALFALLLSEASSMTIGGQRACVAWLLDPQAQSVPQWVGKVDVTALGPVASMLALRAAWQALRVRSANQGRMQWRDSKGRLMTGKGWFDPTPEYPLWLIVLDEAHMLLTDAQYSVEAAYLISNIAKLGRKTGCSMLLASQLSSLSELKDRAVRAMLAGMGAIALRSGENLSAGMIGIEGNAFTLPQIPGLGYTNGPDARPGAWFKATWTGDAERTYDIAEAQQPCSLDEQTREAIRLVAASPKTTAGPKTWMPSWHYSGNGQVLRDAD